MMKLSYTSSTMLHFTNQNQGKGLLKTLSWGEVSALEGY